MKTVAVKFIITESIDLPLIPPTVYKYGSFVEINDGHTVLEGIMRLACSTIIDVHMLEKDWLGVKYETRNEMIDELIKQLQKEKIK